MPYKSKAQQGYLHAKEPEVAAKFDKETPKGAYKKLPEHVKGNAMNKHGSHPEHTVHHGHKESHGAHHHADGSHKEGAGKRVVEYLHAEHEKHSEKMGEK